MPVKILQNTIVKMGPVNTKRNLINKYQMIGQTTFDAEPVRPESYENKIHNIYNT